MKLFANQETPIIKSLMGLPIEISNYSIEAIRFRVYSDYTLNPSTITDIYFEKNFTIINLINKNLPQDQSVGFTYHIYSTLGGGLYHFAHKDVISPITATPGILLSIINEWILGLYEGDPFPKILMMMGG